MSNILAKDFYNNGMGKCVILKEVDDIYKLIYVYDSNQFVVIHDLNKMTGNWNGGSYFGNDLDSALSYFNKRTNQNLEDDYER